MTPHTCEFGNCHETATVYGGFQGAGDWAGYACDIHSQTLGFRVWKHLKATYISLLPL